MPNPHNIPCEHCHGPKPPIALSDPFCSTECCKVAHGLMTEKDRIESAKRQRRGSGAANARRQAKCSGCGCALDNKTPGCKNCYSRHYSRELSKKREQQRAETSPNATLAPVSAAR